MKNKIIAVALFTFLLTNSAWAHSELTGSTPAVGARLSVLPDKFTLKFNESVSVEKGALQLINGVGKVFYSNSTVLEDSTLTISKPKSFKSGVYAFRYSVISPDGHKFTGLIPFSYKFSEIGSYKSINSTLTSGSKKINLLCKCKVGLSQITLDAKATKVVLTLTNSSTKAPFTISLTPNNSSYSSNLLLISKGEYKVKAEVYVNDFNIDTYTGSFKNL